MLGLCSRLLVIGLVGLCVAASVAAETVLIEDQDGAFVYTGYGWRSCGPLPIFSGCTAHQAYEKQPMGTERTNTATVTFTGTSVSLVTIVGPGCGKVTWVLDDGAQTGEIDLSAPTIKAMARVPVVGGLEDTEHYLAFTPVNPPPKPQSQTGMTDSPGNTSVWIDGIEVETDKDVVDASKVLDVLPWPSNGVKVAITLDPENGLGTVGDTFKISYRVSNTGAAKDAKIVCQVYDTNIKVIASSEDEVTLGSDIVFEGTHAVTPTNYGICQIRVKVTDKATGETLAVSQSGVVALMERNVARDEDGQFGAELHPGDEAAIGLMSQIGLAHARVSVDWAAHEPTQGTYVFPLDGIIGAAHGAGVTVLAVIEGKPGWAAGTPEEFAAFVKALAAHYGDKVDAYQLLEAVNTGLHPLVATPAEYVALATAAAKEIRAAAPTAQVAIGGFVQAPGQQDWMDNCLEILRTIPNGLVDAIALRGIGWGSPAAEEYTGRLTSIYAGRENFGRVPIWMTHTGAATVAAGVRNTYEWTEPVQARETVKCAIMAFCGRAGRIYLWDLVDRQAADTAVMNIWNLPDQQATGIYAGAGLFNAKRQPKVAAAMVAAMTNILNGAIFPILQRAGRDSYVTMCQHSMTPTVVFWASGPEANDKVFAKIGWRAYAEEVRILDSMGNARSQKTRNDMIDFLATEAPGYVLDCGEDLALPIPPDMR